MERMDINLRQFVLLVLDAAGGKISGKTYLQKLCFFVGVKTHNKDLGFRPHYYGPYSDQISAEMSFLKGAGYISELRRGSGIADQRGWEMTRYDYAITEEGRKIVESLESAHPKDTAEVKRAIDAVGAAGTLDYIALSVAAKTFWIVNEKRTSPVSLEKVVEEADALSWKILPEQVEAATEFLQKLDLVKRVSRSQ
jgi:uncharacterized protein YwgA